MTTVEAQKEPATPEPKRGLANGQRAGYTPSALRALIPQEQEHVRELLESFPLRPYMKVEIVPLR